MKRQFELLAMGLALTLWAGQGTAQQPTPLDAQADPIVATVDGTAIRRSDVVAMQQFLPTQFQQLPIEVIFPALIERMIDAKLIAAAGRKEKLDQDAEVRARISTFEERVIQEVYLTRRIETAVTDQAVRSRYDKFVKDNPPREEVSARHILVATEAQAKELIAELKKGADFAKLAAERSTDPAGKAHGGSLGFFAREDMVPEFSEAAFKLKEGETTEAPVKSQFGWHVIRVDQRRTVAPAFEEVQERLTAELQQETVTEIVGRLRDGAKVERFNLDGSPVKR